MPRNIPHIININYSVILIFFDIKLFFYNKIFNIKGILN